MTWKQLPPIARRSSSERLPPLRAVLSGAIGIGDLVDVCLRRIEQCDEQIRAWVRVDAEGARRRAGELAAEGAAQAGCLRGVPLGVKDIFDVAGWSTQAGSPLRREHRAELDAPVVARLRSCGTVVLGKTVTTQFACFDPAETRNPWNLTHTPGGSSCGSAAAVATEMCLLALGSQTGGSITRPASYCGVAGIKPTLGRLSTEGVVPVSPHLDHVGLLARSADDLWIGWQALSGAGPGIEPAELVARCQAATLEPPELLTLEPYFDAESSPEVRRVTAAALDQLRAAGARVRAVALPESFHQVHAMHRRIMAVEASRYHRAQFAQAPDQYAPLLAALLREGLALPEVEYTSALEHRSAFRRDMQLLLREPRIAITPATPTTAPARLDTTGDPKFNSPWSYCGFPTVSFPCGVASDGMPCGLQCIGLPDREEALLQAAVWAEEVDCRARGAGF